jgi:hypothetical protein
MLRSLTTAREDSLLRGILTQVQRLSDNSKGVTSKETEHHRRAVGFGEVCHGRIQERFQLLPVRLVRGRRRPSTCFELSNGAAPFAALRFLGEMTGCAVEPGRNHCVAIEAPRFVGEQGKYLLTHVFGQVLVAELTPGGGKYQAQMPFHQQPERGLGASLNVFREQR